MLILPKALQGTGFAAPPIQARAQVVWDIAGVEKCGKTDFLSKVPGRIAYADYDEGADAPILARQFDDRGQRRIYRSTYPRTMSGGLYAAKQFEDLQLGTNADGSIVKKDEEKLHLELMQENRPTVMRMIHDAQVIADSGFFRSYCLDTQDEAWGVIRLAHFGRMSKVPNQLYEKANNDFALLVRTIRKVGMNFIMASKMSDEYETKTNERGQSVNAKTGRLKREGNNKVPFLVEEYFHARKKTGADGKITFELELTQSANKPGLVGTIWRNDEIDFAAIAMQIKPDVDPSAWYDNFNDEEEGK
jgi:hypothetical protein